MTGAFGTDLERGRWLVGAILTHSVGDGEAKGAGLSYGLESTVTAVNPYARVRLSDRLSAWGLVGYGLGRLEIEMKRSGSAAAERYRTDLEMILGALGGRAELLTPGAHDGFALALRGDAFFVRTETDAKGVAGMDDLVAAEGEASRLQLMLEGSRPVTLAGGGTLTPLLEVGLRQDGGDAETGTGLETSAGLEYTDSSSGLMMELRARTLMAHAESNYRESGVSGVVRLTPDAAGRGLSLSLESAFGTDRLWAIRDATQLATGTAADPASRLKVELGYGLPFRNGHFIGTPYLGFGYTETERSYRVGWRLTRPSDTDAFKLSIEASRREADNPERRPGARSSSEHSVGFRLAARW
ncbi:MAG: hypothetical protein F4Z28_08035 [Gammaproteobacteria bacterium]|nr:hypothetical protein [Gammaproteobacteria bacterium]